MVYNNRVTLLGDVIKEQRSKDPTLARVCYHEIEDTVEPGKPPGSFKLKVKHGVVFRPANPKVADGPDGLKPTQVNIAACVPCRTWQSSFTEIVWCVRWSKKGIQPVAPRAVLSKAVALPPGHSLVLSG